ncbi:rRNA maturation RNase YbeY [Enterovirga aerilata]|uniref:Endoribonuclease YbeY n=1 Tax=Enterovirga aerilata TaxID=2730920 RepID=A0A849IDV9_9HYPH|nr:rRNA maturation RNase YbeY [Enterovirga sp. DB1703]
MIALDVEIEAEAWSAITGVEWLATRAAQAALAAARLGEDEDLEATLLLTDDASVRELNRQWRGQDKPTNVLSFPAEMASPPGEPRHLGDIALAYETVAREAEAEGKPLPNHMAHLVVHGLLHLLGHDHETDPEAERMERAEVLALEALGIPDPYREPSGRADLTRR